MAQTLKKSRILSTILALALIVGLAAAPVAAATETDPPETQDSEAVTTGADGENGDAEVELGDAETEPWDNPFVDVAEEDWFYSHVAYAVSHGLFAGTGDDTFSPDVLMSRGMVVTILANLANVDPENFPGASFSDVGEDAYYAAFVKWASEHSIINGIGNNLFAPEKPVSRQDFAVVLHNYAIEFDILLPDGAKTDEFADIDAAAGYAAEAIDALRLAGIISGRPGGMFDPHGTLTRAEAASMLHMFRITIMQSAIVALVPDNQDV